jgi:hypothetical protein
MTSKPNLKPDACCCVVGIITKCVFFELRINFSRLSLRLLLASFAVDFFTNLAFGSVCRNFTLDSASRFFLLHSKFQNHFFLPPDFFLFLFKSFNITWLAAPLGLFLLHFSSIVTEQTEHHLALFDEQSRRIFQRTQMLQGFISFFFFCCFGSVFREFIIKYFRKMLDYLSSDLSRSPI